MALALVKLVNSLGTINYSYVKFNDQSNSMHYCKFSWIYQAVYRFTCTMALAVDAILTTFDLIHIKNFSQTLEGVAGSLIW